MKAIGYALCSTCQVLTRAYAPRGWKAGEALHVWQHAAVLEAGFRNHCPGSYKAGTGSRTDVELDAGKVPV
jgi:hypothetical protein